MSPAPIILFVYNRLDHTQKVITALQNNLLSTESELHIYSDAPANEMAVEKVQMLRAYLPAISGFKKVHIHHRETNLGVDENIISGVTEVINLYGKAIVLEDDILTSPWFLKYMNDGLDFYENQDQVASIHGYTYPIKQGLKEVFFLKGADCWGWATWTRAWDLFEPDGQKLLEQLSASGLQKEFDFQGTYPYSQALKDQATGKTTCWDIRWYASAFLLNKVTLYPGISMVDNIGLDGSGVHCGENNNYKVELAGVAVSVQTQIGHDFQGYQAFVDFLRQIGDASETRKKSWLSRSLKRLKTSIKNNQLSK